MTYVSSSKVKNIQRMSRAMRYQNKKIAKILLFCNEIDESLDYISSIKEYDTDFNRKINYLSISEKYKNVKERIKFNHENIEKNKIIISGIKLYKGKTWTQILELVKKYIDENNKRPSRNNENADIKMLGKWIDTHLQNFRNKIYINKNQDKYNSWIEFINNYKIHFDNHIKWFHYLVQLKKYINDNNKLPSQYDDNIENAKIYSWLNGQQYKYRHKKGIMINNDFYNLWTEFIWDNNYKIYFENYKYFEKKKILWFSYLNNVKIYIKKNNKRPSSSDDNKEIRNLGYWIANQQTYYKNIKNIMKESEIYNLWAEFINDGYYKKYLENNYDLWFNNFNLLKIFFNENNKKPSENDNKFLSSWMYSQKTNYIYKNNIMKDDYIYNLWSEFINHENYKIYFENYYYDENNRKFWINQLNEIKKYINKNNKRPLQQDEDKEIKKLGKWLYNQQDKYYDTNKNKDTNYTLWLEFINDDNYKMYFQDKNTLWISKLNDIKIYISKNDKLPTNNKNKILCNWLNRQLTIYHNREYIMKDDIIYNLWIDFINDNKKLFKDSKIIWIDNLNLVKTFLNENNKKPSKYNNISSRYVKNDKKYDDDNNEYNINKKLCNWISNQQVKYNKKEHIMLDEEIYNLWTNFIKDYNKFFEDKKNNIWLNKLIQLKKYIDKNNNIPSHQENNILANWINIQLIDYIKREQIMKLDKYYHLWAEFINDNNYKSYFYNLLPINDTKEQTIRKSYKIIMTCQLCNTTIKANEKNMIIHQQTNKCKKLRNSFAEV
jgi:hypothetical protein